MPATILEVDAEIVRRDQPAACRHKLRRWIEDQGLAILHNAPQSEGFEIAVGNKVDDIVQTQNIRFMRQKT